MPEEKIRTSKKALAELEEMNNRSVNTNPIPWKQIKDTSLKIASLNCMNLSNNYEHIICDNTLMESSILTLCETWLDNTTYLKIDGYRAHFNSVGPGKGIAVYLKNNTFTPTVNINEKKMQLTKLESENLDIIIVYRSEQGNTTELLSHIITMLREETATVICGDFNICYKTNKTNKISKFLETNGFKQHVQEPTHLKGRHIDHFYFKPSLMYSADPSIHRYTPYYSDHDAICATLQSI